MGRGRVRVYTRRIWCELIGSGSMQPLDNAEKVKHGGSEDLRAAKMENDDSVKGSHQG